MHGVHIAHTHRLSEPIASMAHAAYPHFLRAEAIQILLSLGAMPCEVILEKFKCGTRGVKRSVDYSDYQGVLLVDYYNFCTMRGFCKFLSQEGDVLRFGTSSNEHKR